MNQKTSYGIIGLIASLVAIFVFITGKESIPAILNDANSNNSQPKSSLPPSRFEGKWSDEGEITAKSKLEISIDQISDKISGLITYKEWNNRGETTLYSGLCSIVGHIEGGTAYIEIYTQNGYIDTKAKLIKEGDYIEFKATKQGNFFPSKKMVWRQNSLRLDDI